MSSSGVSGIDANPLAHEEVGRWVKSSRRPFRQFFLAVTKLREGGSIERRKPALGRDAPRRPRSSDRSCNIPCRRRTRGCLRCRFGCRLLGGSQDAPDRLRRKSQRCLCRASSELSATDRSIRRSSAGTIARAAARCVAAAGCGESKAVVQGWWRGHDGSRGAALRYRGGRCWTMANRSQG